MWKSQHFLIFWPPITMWLRNWFWPFWYFSLWQQQFFMIIQFRLVDFCIFFPRCVINLKKLIWWECGLLGGLDLSNIDYLWVIHVKRYQHKETIQTFNYFAIHLHENCMNISFAFLWMQKIDFCPCKWCPFLTQK